MIQADIDRIVDTIVNTYSGQSVAYHGAYPSEPIVPIAYYVEQLTEVPLTEMPSSWETGVPSIVLSRFKQEQFSTSRSYPKGTILLWNDSHSAILLSQHSGTTAAVFEQANTTEGVRCTINYDKQLNTDLYSCIYALVPIREDVERPKPVTYMTNTVDGITYTTFDKPTRYYVSRTQGADKRQFSNANNWRDFVTVNHYSHGTEIICMGQAVHPVAPAGATFYLTVADWGAFGKTGVADKLVGFISSDLSDIKPPAIVEPPIAQVAPQPIQDVVKRTVPEWQDTYTPFSANNVPDTYVVIRDLDIRDFSGQYGAVRVGPGTKLKTLKIYGTFWIDGTQYGRAKPPGDTEFKTWYGVPFNDPETNEPYIIDEIDTISTASRVEERVANKTAKPRDYVQYAGSTIEKYTESLYNRLKFNKQKRKK